MLNDYKLFYIKVYMMIKFKNILFVFAFLVFGYTQDLFDYNQSSMQAFYFIESAKIGEENLEPNDMIGAFCNNVCVGSNFWQGSWTEIPAMGNDGSQWTNGYCIDGDYPTFQIYDSSEDQYLLTISSSVVSALGDEYSGWGAELLFNIENIDVPLDCYGTPNGTAFIDDCGICSGGETDHEANSDYDCNEECFGDAIIDDCNICTGGGTGLEFNYLKDCNGECFGTAFIDNCDVCVEEGIDPDSNKDCNGDCFGDAIIDECSDCSGGLTGFEENYSKDCNGVCYGTAIVDDCEVCSGGNTGIDPNDDKDCYGDCFGYAFLDDCEICSGGNSNHIPNSDLDCVGFCFGDAFLDNCDVCVGGSTGLEPCQEDCAGVINGEAFIDSCGYCVGGSTGLEVDFAKDCEGSCDGNAFIDDCGVCSGGETGHEANIDIDCFGLCFGEAIIDDCGICSGGETDNIPNDDLDACGICFGENEEQNGVLIGPDVDCNGLCFGEAIIDDCGICSGGETDNIPNNDLDACGICFGENEEEDGFVTGPDADCAGVCFGEAFLDSCDVCSGGSSGHIANSDIDSCSICFGENEEEDGFITGPDADCAGVCFGEAYIDDCNICSDGTTNNIPNINLDCNGDCFGEAVIDWCGECTGGNSGKEYNEDLDACDVCFGENQEEDGFITGPDADCAGVCFGSAIVDDCEICSGGTSGHIGNSDQDVCGICFGENQELDGFVIGPDADCAGVCFGEAYLDDCSICSAGTTNHIPNIDLDCNEDCFGEASIDYCGTCSGGETGLEPGLNDVGCGCFELAPQIYYLDIDNDGLGYGEGIEFCLFELEDGWVENNDDLEPNCQTNDIDDCDICGGQNLDLDCNNICFGDAELDECDVCDGDGSSCNKPVASDQFLSTLEDDTLFSTLDVYDPTDDPLTIFVTLDPSNGSLVIDGIDFIYTPNENYVGPDFFYYVAYDGLFYTSPIRVEIEMIEVNDEPQSISLNLMTNEDQSMIITVIGTDVESSDVTFEITSMPENGELSDILRSIGSVEYYPNANFFGLDSFAYRVSDGELYSQESLVTIEVLPINDPPFLVGEWFSIDEDTETILPLNLGDPDDDDIVVELLSGPFNGVFEYEDSQYVYTPNEDYIGHDVMLLQAKEVSTPELFYSYPTPVHIVINEVNDAPISYNAEYLVDEDSSVDIELFGFDPEQSDIVFFIDQNPDNGTLSGSLPNITYSPNNDFDGIDYFTFFVKDDLLAVSNIATVTININSINDIPVVSRADFENVIPTGYNFDLSPFINDVDNDELDIEFLPSNNGNGLCFLGGSITSLGNNLFHYENSDPYQFDYILYKAKDLLSESSYALAYFSIPSGRDYGNRSTTLSYDQDINASEKAVSEFSLIGSNIFSPFPLDGINVDFRIVEYPTFGEIDTLNMILEVSDASGTEGTIVNFTGQYEAPSIGGSNDSVIDSFTYQIYNPTSDEWSEVSQVNIAIYGINDQPTISSINDQSVNEDDSISITFYVDDEDGPIDESDISFSSNNDQNFSYYAILDNANDINEVILMVEPLTDYNGDVLFTIELTDGEILSPIVENFTLDIVPLNDPPFLSQFNDINFDEEGSIQIPITAFDVDGDTEFSYSLEILSNPDILSIEIQDSVLSIHGEENYFGTSTVRLIAYDGIAYSDPMEFNININNINDVPYIDAITYPLSINEDSENFEIVLTPIDFDSDEIIVSVNNFNLDIIPNDNIYIEPVSALSNIERIISLDPLENKYGNFNILIGITDGNSPLINIEVPVSINPVNDSPEIIDPGLISFEEDKDTFVILQAYDQENDSIRYSYIYDNSNLQITLNHNVINIESNQNYFGSDLITLLISDYQDTTVQNLNIEVLPVNDPPIITSIASTTAYEDSLYNYQVIVSDVDDDSFVYILNNQPEDMTIDDTGHISWVPLEGVLSSGIFTVTVKDGENPDALMDYQEISINVIPINDAPQIISTPLLLATEDIQYFYQVEVIDPDNDNFIFELINQPSNMVINSEGYLTWTPLEGELSSGLVTLNVYDGLLENSFSDQQQFAIFVTPVNDSPIIISNPELIAYEDIVYNYEVLVLDPDDTEFDFVLNQGPEGMSISENGVVSWLPLEGVLESGEISISVFDGGEDNSISSTQIYSITVETINDSPVIISNPNLQAIEDILYEYQLEIQDPDDTEFTFSLYSYPLGMTINQVGLIEWTPLEGVLSSGPVIVKVVDGGENLSSPDIQTFVIDVMPVNDSPIIISIPNTSAIEDLEYAYQVIVSDPDDTEFTYELLESPLNMSISNLGLIQWVPINGVLSSDTVIVNVLDGGEDNSMPAQQQFVIDVTPINDAPEMEIISIDSLNAIEDILWTYQVIASDPDDSILNFSLSNAPIGMEVDEFGLISWTPLEGILTSGNVELIVSDGLENGVLPINQFFEVLVTPVNDPPSIVQINPDLLFATEDILWNYQIEVEDPDDDEWTYNIFMGPDSMEISNTGLIAWTPLEGIFTSGTIIVQVSDGGEDGTIADLVSFIVTVTSVNDAPIIISEPPLFGQTNVMYSYEVIIEDPDDNDFNISIYGAPIGMSINDDRIISWLPNEEGTYGPILLIVSDDGEDNAPPAMQEFSIYIEQTTELTTTYNVSEGSNLISFYGVPADNSVSNVLEPANDFAVGLIGEGVAASQIAPGLWVGSLLNIELTDGYWLLVGGEDNAQYEFEVTAPPPDITTMYHIQEGANLISYIGSDGMAITNAFPDEIEFNITGLIGAGVAASQIAPEFWVGSLAYLEQRKGYWLLSEDTFDYSWELDNNFTKLDYLESNMFEPEIFNFNQSTKQAFYFVENLNISETIVSDGDWLLSYCNNILVGSREWNGTYTDIPVMGNDGNLKTQGYCEEGSIPSFKFYDLSMNKFYELDAELVPEWENNNIFHLEELSAIINNPQVYNLEKPYPNPFNPLSTINFSIPERSHLSIIIYDIKGQQVDVLHNQMINAGYHELIWDATSLSSGVYFVNMISGSYNSVQKMILLK